MTSYFITICAHMYQNRFQRDEVAELMVATLFKYRDVGEFELHEYVVMPDHIHVLVSLPDGQPLSRIVQLIKGGFSHTLREHGIAMRTVWQSGHHDRRVRDENEFAEMVEYVRQNPVRRGLVQEAEEYPYSSAGRGLKPLSLKKHNVDANLKVRSTVPSSAKVNEGAVAKLRSTVSSDAKCDEGAILKTCNNQMFAQDDTFSCDPAKSEKRIADREGQQEF
jgi:putative transposase